MSELYIQELFSPIFITQNFKNMIKNIVFDFGGVIADISRDKAVQAFFKIGLKDAETRLDKYHQTGIFQELEEGKLSADEFRE